jgi:2-dehydro-3-deoxyphosphooctonate aldolase (KDO 8-P synthase)
MRRALRGQGDGVTGVVTDPVHVVDVTPTLAIGDGRFTLLGGPCVIETEVHSVDLAGRIRDVCASRGVQYVFKSSFDKANRTSVTSYRGPGLEAGLAVLDTVKRTVGVPVLTDIHEPDQAAPAAAVCDVLQIPAFLCRQTDLLLAAAATDRVVNVKKAQFLAADDMRHVVRKLEAGGATRILVTERGTSFGYHNLVVDFRSLATMRTFGYPVVFDATHSVQMPGGGDGVSSGDRRFVEPLARAAVAIGVDALFMEIHDDPDRAPSDGPNMVRFDHLGPMLDRLLRIHEAASDAAELTSTRA